MNTIHRFAILPASALAFSLLTLAPCQLAVAQNPSKGPTSTPVLTQLPDEEALHQELRDMKKNHEDAVKIAET